MTLLNIILTVFGLILIWFEIQYMLHIKNDEENNYDLKCIILCLGVLVVLYSIKSILQFIEIEKLKQALEVLASAR